MTSTASLPPIDHIARELWKRGAREAALDLLRACVMRDPTARASAALLRAVEARPDASVSGPDIALDIELVDALAGQGMILEARALVLGAQLAGTEAGQDRIARFDLVLLPVPAEIARVWHEALAQVHMGSGRHALSLIEAEELRGNLAPPFVIERRNLLREILSVTAVDRPSARPIGQSRLAVSVNPTEMMEVAADETTKVGKPIKQTQDPVLVDTETTTPSMPVPEAVASELAQPALRKRIPSGAPGGIYGSRRKSPSGLALGSAATSTLSLDEEAELLIRQGYPEQSLALYRALMTQATPDPRLEKKCLEIEELIASRSHPLPTEPTVRRDEEALRRAAVRTDATPAVSISDFPQSGILSTIPAPNANAPDMNSSVLVRRILRVG